MEKRTHNKFAAEAAMHGIKLPMRYDEGELKAEELPPEAQAVLDRALIEAKKRKENEMTRGK